MQPHTYQDDAAAEVIKLIDAGQHPVLLQSPTASGKTFIAMNVINHYVTNRNWQTLFVVNRQPLVEQSYATATLVNVMCAVLHNDIKKDKWGNYFSTDLNHKLVITMPETFHNVKDVMPVGWAPNFIVLDEAHKATSEIFQQLVQLYPNAVILGLTATPARAKNKEGESLREWYKSFVTTISIRELITLGQLVQPEYLNFNEDAHVVNTWLTLTANEANRRTIVFCQDTKHMEQVYNAFIAANISAAMILTSDEAAIAPLTINQRLAIFKDYAEGKVEVLISINALCEGFDERQAHYCFLLRDVRNIALYHQMVGRVLRSYPGKKEGYVVDFCTNFERFGPVEDWEWDLNDDAETTFAKLKTGTTLISSGTWARKDKIYLSCTNCHHVYDIKKHSKCIYCTTPHNVRRETQVEKIRNTMYAKINPNYISTLKSNNSVAAFNALIDKLNYAQDNKKGKAMNKVLGVDFFVDDVKIASRYKFINPLMKMRREKTFIKMEDKVVY